MSRDGRYVAFTSDAANLVAGDTNGSYDVFVRDNLIGTTTRVSTDSRGVQGNFISEESSIAVANDGTVYVAFGSYASNLVEGDTNNTTDVFVKNMSTGITSRVSTDSSGKEGDNSSASSSPALKVANDGTVYVAFASFASNLVADDTNESTDVFLKNMLTGATTRVSTDSNGNQTDKDFGFGGNSEPSMAIAGDGTVLVAFHSYSGKLVAGDTNGFKDIFVKNMTTGSTIRASTDSNGNQADNGMSFLPSLAVAIDGTAYVAFDSFATNLVPGDTNGSMDIFLKNLSSGATTLVNTTANGDRIFGSDEVTPSLAIAGDGTVFVAFSISVELVPGRFHGTIDTYLKNMSTGTATRAVDADEDLGSNALGKSSDIALAVSGNGTIFIAFDSVEDAIFTSNVFVWTSDVARHVRSSTADFNGDRTPDTALGNGPGTVSVVRVLDGKTNAQIFTVQPFEASFTGGVFLAIGDINGDGTPELIVSADRSGGPILVVYDGRRVASGRSGSDAELIRFYGIDDSNFRGGAHVTVADINGDGLAEIIVSAGFLGGPRITIWDGRSILSGSPVQLANFFAFDETLRTGADVTAGDFDGDGLPDLAFGGGLDGGPRVRIVSGMDIRSHLISLGLSSLDSDLPVPRIADFFSGDPNSRNGIRLTTKTHTDAVSDDLVVGSGTNPGSRVTIYPASSFKESTTPVGSDIDAFNYFDPGIFVG